jgi:hypothetical protein
LCLLSRINAVIKFRSIRQVRKGQTTLGAKPPGSRTVRAKKNRSLWSVKCKQLSRDLCRSARCRLKWIDYESSDTEVKWIRVRTGSCFRNGATSWAETYAYTNSRTTMNFSSLGATIIIIIIIIIIWFVRLLALRSLLAYCASLG